MATQATGSGTMRTPYAERGDDLYETPEVAVEALLRHVPVRGPVWEPACGPGAIVRVLRRHGYEVHASDLVDYASPDQDRAGLDFLMAGPADVPDGCRTILTNPPFKIIDRFIGHALTLVPEVVILGRLSLLESERRSPILDDAGLQVVLPFRKRLPMMHRAGWEGRKASSGIPFAWFVWNARLRTETVIRRISWDRPETHP